RDREGRQAARLILDPGQLLPVRQQVTGIGPDQHGHDVLLVVSAGDDGVVAGAGVLRDAAGHERRLVVEFRLALGEEVGEVVTGRAFALLVEVHAGEERAEPGPARGLNWVQGIDDRPGRGGWWRG